MAALQRNHRGPRLLVRVPVRSAPGLAPCDGLAGWWVGGWQGSGGGRDREWRSECVRCVRSVAGGGHAREP
eukprot:scaffold3261_cov67-Phaeocystis_antarctica.AAC.6